MNYSLTNNLFREFAKKQIIIFLQSTFQSRTLVRNRTAPMKRQRTHLKKSSRLPSYTADDENEIETNAIRTYQEPILKEMNECRQYETDYRGEKSPKKETKNSKINIQVKTFGNLPPIEEVDE